jgi:L-asparaginase
VVLTQGTDTIEEVAFALDLLWNSDAPIVVTGAMRNPSLPGADGPANLLAAIRVALAGAVRGLGVVVVMNDEVHAARFVRKVHTSSLGAFQSVATGPIGSLSEGYVRIVTRPVGRTYVGVKAEAAIPAVALVRLALGDDGRLLSTLSRLGYAGAVIEGMGGGHVAEGTVPLVRELTRQMPVVLASRTGSGDVLTATYRFRGSEIDLLEAGVISAGQLDGVKSRLLLSLCLAAGYAPERIGLEFARFGAGPSSSPSA